MADNNVASLVKFICLCTLQAALVYCKNADIASKDSLILTVEHALESDMFRQPYAIIKTGDVVYKPRGVINVKNIKGFVASYMDNDNTSEDFNEIRNAANRDSFYYVRIPIKSQNENGDERSYYISTFIKSCSLVMSNFSDIIKLHVDNSGNIFAVGLSTTMADCSNVNLKKFVVPTDSFNTAVSLSHVVNGPAPDTQTYIKKLEEERREKQRGKGKDNRSFFAKYWMYIVPLVIFLMLSGQEQPAGGAGSGSGGAGGN